MTNILIVLSAADRWTRADGSIYESGVWAEEFVAMDEAFVQAGFQIDIANPGGVAPTMDKRSLDSKIVGQDVAERMRSYLARNSARVEKPLVLAELDMGRYDAVVVPGGHGPVEDLYKDPDMGRVLVQANREAKVIAAVCHGPAALLAARDENGQWPFAGRRMTSLTDEEEIEFGTAENAPWLLADTLCKSGAVFEQVMMRTENNPEGLPPELFDQFRASLAANRAEFYREIAAGPFYGFNRDGAKVSQGLADNWWRQSMMGGAKAQYDCIAAFSATDFTADLKAIDVPVLVMHGADDQIVPIQNHGPKAVELLKNGTLKAYDGLSHGMASMHPDVVNADLLAFFRS